MPKGIYHRSEEHKRNIGLSLLGKNKKPKTPGFGTTMSNLTTLLWQNPEHKKNHLEAMNRPETKEIASQNMKQLWRDSKYREKQLKAIFKGFHHLPNRPEKFLTEFLQKLLPNQWKYVGDGKDENSFVAGKCPDFVNINGQKKVIEFNGGWWHGEVVTGRTKKEEERQRIDLFAKEGYQTLIIWECELDDIDLLTRKIISFHSI